MAEGAKGSANGTNLGSNTSEPSGGSPPQSKSKIPIIVGVVVGIGGALVLAALAACLFWRRRNSKHHKLEEGDDQPGARSSVDAAVATATNGSPRPPASQQPLMSEASAERSRTSRGMPTRRRIVQERDAVEAGSHLPPPPTYRGDGEEPVAGQARSPARLPAGPSSTIPTQDTEPESAVRGGAFKPALKAAYARIFGFHSLSQFAASSGTNTGVLRQPRPSLKEEYRLMYGPADSVPSDHRKNYYMPTPEKDPATHAAPVDATAEEARESTPVSEQRLGPKLPDSLASSAQQSSDTTLGEAETPTQQAPTCQEDFRLSEDLNLQNSDCLGRTV